MEPDNANVTWRIYYPGGGLRVQTTSTDNLSYLVQDHLNSTALTLNSTGSVTGEMIYSAFGETRFSFGAIPTDRLYTGQYEAEVGLYFYNARWYDPYLNHFVQPDTIIPDPSNPQSWNRYAYVNNNPINYNDPSGHCIEIEPGFCVREDRNSGKTNIVYSTDGRFNNYVEQALANAVLSGNTNYLNQIPNNTPGFMVGAALENACKGIGLDCGEYYNNAFMILSTVILDIGNIRYPGTSYNNVPGSVRSDALGDPDCIGCGYSISGNINNELLSPFGYPIDPTSPPANGFIWRGDGLPGSDKGNWWNPNTKEWLHYDPSHHGIPHYDYRDPFGNRFRIWPNGRMTPKY